MTIQLPSSKSPLATKNPTKRVDSGLIERIAFTVKTYVLDDSAKAFHVWLTKFFEHNPGIACDFDVTLSADEVGGYLEIIQMNRCIPLETLECLYEYSARLE